MASEILEPINLGGSELVTINQLVDLVEESRGQTAAEHRLNAPRGQRPEQRQYADPEMPWMGTRHAAETVWRRPTADLRSDGEGALVQVQR